MLYKTLALLGLALCFGHTGCHIKTQDPCTYEASARCDDYYYQERPSPPPSPPRYVEPAQTAYEPWSVTAEFFFVEDGNTVAVLVGDRIARVHLDGVIESPSNIPLLESWFFENPYVDVEILDELEPTQWLGVIWSLHDQTSLNRVLGN